MFVFWDFGQERCFTPEISRWFSPLAWALAIHDSRLSSLGSELEEEVVEAELADFVFRQARKDCLNLGITLPE